jgi:DUF4097 and DUF4098 domain-containing protein YvlB
MNDIMTPTRPEPTRSERSKRLGLILLLAFGVLLMLIASNSRGGEMLFTATRTDRFTTAVTPRTSIRIDNVSGDIVVVPGKSFAVTVTVAVSAPTQKRADEVLARTVIWQAQDDDVYTLETRWPDSRRHWDGRNRRSPEAWCEDCRITAKYDVTLPAGVSARLATVNGEVNVRDVDAELDLSSVNGNVRAVGARRSVRAHTVNGKVEATAAQLPAGASWDCRTVNGAVTLTFPKDARFDLHASVMSGAISSTFALPSHAEPDAYPVLAEPPKSKDKVKEKDKIKEAERERRKVYVGEDGDEVEVDISEIEREVEREMREVQIEMRRAQREMERSAVLALPLGRSYTGSMGQGGASVKVSTLNGAVTVLAAGTGESEAKALVSPRRTVSITIPPMVVVAPHIAPIAPSAPAAPAVPGAPAAAPAVAPAPAPRGPRPPHTPRSLPPGEEETIVRGDISGDFLSTRTSASYEVGKVSGRVRILTNLGEIHVASVGGAADLKTYGGDIVIGPVGGEFRALTMAGDVKAGAVGGAATCETSGGDIRIDSVKGALEARTAGGDVVVRSIGGPADVETGGGEVRISLTSRQAAVSVRNAGGDVTVTLPADFRGEFDLQVDGASPDEAAIRCDFPQIGVVTREDRQQATGSINGGGARVVVRTSSGKIRIRKG